MIDTLSKLFGSTARVKILRLFLSNKNSQLTLQEISKRAKVQVATVRKEVALFKKISLIKESSCIRMHKVKNKKNTEKKKTEKCFSVDYEFSYLNALSNLILESDAGDGSFIESQLKRAGRVKMIVISGVFVHNTPNAQVDILIVADNAKRSKIESAIREIESRLGQELRYALFSSEDFKYRMDVYDKLLRDIFDYPHEILLDKINVR